MKSLPTRIRETLITYSGKVLIADPDHAWTGTQLSHKMKAIDEALSVSTLPGSLVGVCFPNMATKGLAILSVLQAGRIPVILSYADLTTQTQTWLERVSMDLLLTTAELSELCHNQVNVLELNADGEKQNLRLQHRPLPLVQAPEGTALVLYTSGSTGAPKGICVPEAGILLTCDYLKDYFGLTAETITPIILPVCHSMALNTQFLPTFLCGGQSTFIQSRFEMNKLFRLISQTNGTFVSLIGDVLRICWDEMKRRGLAPNEKVRHVQLAGGLISKRHLEMASELFPNALIHKGYGLTEGIRVTMIDHRDPDFLNNVLGHPLPFQRVQVRNGDGSPSASGEVGEIFVKGPNVTLGVLGAKSNVVGTDGYLGTGDLGSLCSLGKLSIVGRKDSVFKINGLKVSGLEIETIAGTVSSYVRDSKCILVEDHRKVKDKIILFLEISKDRQAEFYQSYFEVFHQALWAQFKSLAYFPKDIIIMPKFPRTSNGKLAISELHQLWKDQNAQRFIQESHGAFLFYKTDYPLDAVGEGSRQ